MTLARDPLPLAGRRVLVTGASRRAGIGFAIACRLAAYGASVACHRHDVHDEAQNGGAEDPDDVLAGVAEHLSPGAKVIGIEADLADPQAPAALIARAAAELGPLDGLVANQAINGVDAALSEVSAEMLDAHFAVDYRASVLLAQAFAAQLSAEAGGIVFLTSGQGSGPMPGEVAYAGAKAAIAGITPTLALELAPQGIRVNAVNPGPVDTGWFTPELQRFLAPAMVLGRDARPDDPARLIAWLLTSEAEWITGQVISTEGGFERSLLGRGS